MKKFLLSVALIITAGCAVQPQEPQELNATHGFAYASLPNAMLGAASTMSLRSLRDGKKYQLRHDVNSPRGIGLWVPEGEYVVVEMLKEGESSYKPITVEAGRMTDIGGLLWFDIGNYESVLLPIHHQELDVNMRAAFEKNKAYLRGKKVIPWAPEHPPAPLKIPMQATGLGLVVDLMMEYNRYVNTPSLNSRLKAATTIESFFDIAVQSVAPVTSEGIADEEGNLYFGADLGQVRIRRIDGKWSSINTGTLAPITAIAMVDKKIVAISKAGVIQLSDEGKRNWKSLAVLPEGFIALDIDKTDAGWLIVAGHLLNNGVMPVWDDANLFVASDESFSDLRVLKHIMLPGKQPFLYMQGRVIQRSYVLNTFYDIQRFTPETGQWKSIKPGHNTSNFFVDPRTGLLTAFLSQGAFSELSVSSDLGASWHEVSTPSYPTLDVAFTDSTNAYAVRYEMNAFSTSMELLSYDKPADDWKLITKAPDTACNRMLSDPYKRMFFCISSNGSILKFDQGRLTPEFIIH